MNEPGLYGFIAKTGTYRDERATRSALGHCTDVALASSAIGHLLPDAHFGRDFIDPQEVSPANPNVGSGS